MKAGGSRVRDPYCDAARPLPLLPANSPLLPTPPCCSSLMGHRGLAEGSTLHRGPQASTMGLPRIASGSPNLPPLSTRDFRSGASGVAGRLVAGTGASRDFRVAAGAGAERSVSGIAPPGVQEVYAKKVYVSLYADGPTQVRSVYADGRTQVRSVSSHGCAEACGIGAALIGQFSGVDVQRHAMQALLSQAAVQKAVCVCTEAGSGRGFGGCSGSAATGPVSL